MERHKEPEAGEALTHFEQQEDEMGDLLLELECPWLVVPAVNLLLSPQGQRNLTLAPLPQTTGSLPICPSSSDDPVYGGQAWHRMGCLCLLQSCHTISYWGGGISSRSQFLRP